MLAINISASQGTTELTTTQLKYKKGFSPHTLIPTLNTQENSDRHEFDPLAGTVRLSHTC